VATTFRRLQYLVAVRNQQSVSHAAREMNIRNRLYWPQLMRHPTEVEIGRGSVADALMLAWTYRARQTLRSGAQGQSEKGSYLLCLC